MYRIHYLVDELGVEVARVDERATSLPRSAIETLMSQRVAMGRETNRDYHIQTVDYWPSGRPVAGSQRPMEDRAITVSGRGNDDIDP